MCVCVCVCVCVSGAGWQFTFGDVRFLDEVFCVQVRSKGWMSSVRTPLSGDGESEEGWIHRHVSVTTSVRLAEN